MIEQPGFSLTRVAGADLSNRQFRPLALNSDGQVVVTEDVDDEAYIGILQNKPKDGYAASVMIMGVSKARAAAAISAGDLVIPADGGVQENSETTAGENAMIVGIALQDAANAGEIISVLLRGAMQQAA